MVVWCWVVFLNFACVSWKTGWSHWEYAGKKRGKVTASFFHGLWYGSEQQWNWASLECKKNPFSEITVKLHKGRELRGFQSDSLLTFLCYVLFDSKEDTEPWEIWQEWKMCNNMYQVCEIVAGDTRKWNSTPVSIKTSSFSWSWVFFSIFTSLSFIQHVLISFTPLAQLFTDPPSSPSCSTFCLLLFMPFKMSLCFLNIYGCVIIHWSVVRFSEATILEKTIFPFPATATSSIDLGRITDPTLSPC